MPNRFDALERTPKVREYPGRLTPTGATIFTEGTAAAAASDQGEL